MSKTNTNEGGGSGFIVLKESGRVRTDSDEDSSQISIRKQLKPTLNTIKN